MDHEEGLLQREEVTSILEAKVVPEEPQIIEETSEQVDEKIPGKWYQEGRERAAYTPNGTRVVLGSRDENMILAELRYLDHYPKLRAELHPLREDVQYTEDFRRRFSHLFPEDEEKQSDITKARTLGRQSISRVVQTKKLSSAEDLEGDQEDLDFLVNAIHGVEGVCQQVNKIYAEHFYRRIKDHLEESYPDAKVTMGTVTMWDVSIHADANETVSIKRLFRSKNPRIRGREELIEFITQGDGLYKINVNRKELWERAREVYGELELESKGFAPEIRFYNNGLFS